MIDSNRAEPEDGAEPEEGVEPSREAEDWSCWLGDDVSAVGGAAESWDVLLAPGTRREAHYSPTPPPGYTPTREELHRGFRKGSQL